MTRRRIATVALMAGALLVPGARAEAQHPLAIYCSSLTQEYCMSVFAYEYTALASGSNSFSMDFRLFGSGYVAGGTYLLRVSTAPPDCSTSVIQGRATATGPGDYSLGDSDVLPASCVPDLTLQPSVGDITEILFNTLAGAPIPSCSPRAGTCVEVPEPGSIPLLATGIFGLGALAWRRKRKEESA